MRKIIALIAAVTTSGAAIIAAAPSASAAPITYTDSFTASGSLGGVAFTDDTVVVTASTDTADVMPGSSQAFANNVSASVQVGGFAPATLTDTIDITMDVPQGYVFIADESVAALAVNLTSDLDPTTLEGYELTTSIGPVTTYGYTCVSTPPCVYPTTSGGLNSLLLSLILSIQPIQAEPSPSPPRRRPSPRP